MLKNLGSARGVEAVLFDLDDTLFDHIGASRTALLTAFEAVAPQADAAARERAPALWSELEDRFYQAFLAGEMTHAEQRRRRTAQFLQAYGAAADDRAVQEWLSGYLGVYESLWRPFDDVGPALTFLAGLDPAPRLAVVTNGQAEIQEAKLRALGIGDLPIFPSSRVGAAKPDPRIFHQACQAIGVAPQRSLFVGDNPVTDVAGAAGAGLRPVWLDRSRPTDLDQDPPRLSTLGDLPRLWDAG